MMAVQFGLYKMPEVLIKAGARLDIQCRVDGKTALIYAAECANTRAAELLITAGADFKLRDKRATQHWTMRRKSRLMKS